MDSISFTTGSTLSTICAFVALSMSVLVSIPMKSRSRSKPKGVCNVIIDNRLYNLDSYLKYHPGGKRIIQQFNGKDCTEFFNTIHSKPAEIAKLILPKYYVMETFNISNMSKANVDHHQIQTEFEQMIKDADYPCICAKTAIYANQHKFVVTDSNNYDEMSLQFIQFMIEQQTQWKKSQNATIFTTFIVCFADIKHADIYEFETFLFNILEYLHNFEARYKLTRINMSKPLIDKDSKLHSLSFNFFERSFFVAGLSPHSQRKARNFKYPTLVFNALNQFDLMYNEYDTIKKIICKRESNFDGNHNPMIDLMPYFGEAIAFSGRQILDSTQTWICPLWWLSSQANIQETQIEIELQRLKELMLVQRKSV